VLPFTEGQDPEQGQDLHFRSREPLTEDTAHWAVTAKQEQV